jgi:hypothetical protein
MARKPEIRVSDYFKLNKTQAQLDFVDVPVIGDVLLFVDPYSFTLEEDDWFVECNNLLVDYFSRLIESIRANRSDQASKVQDKATMLKRCKDVLNANRGRIFVLDDDDIKHLLKLRSEQKRKEISAFMNEKMRELLM